MSLNVLECPWDRVYIGIIEKWVKDSKPKTNDNQLRTSLTFYRFSTENYRQIVNLLNVASGGIGRRGAVYIV